jgi:hypothetical protein
VIAGNGSAELNSEPERRAFGLFRANSKDVEIVTYGGIFRKLNILSQTSIALQGLAPNSRELGRIAIACTGRLA